MTAIDTITTSTRAVLMSMSLMRSQKALAYVLPLMFSGCVLAVSHVTASVTTSTPAVSHAMRRTGTPFSHPCTFTPPLLRNPRTTDHTVSSTAAASST